jgi:hypothetical protein
MDAPFPSEMLGLGLAMICVAALLGYFLQRGCGTLLLAVAAMLATGLSLAGAALGGWIGLLVAVLTVGLLAYVAGDKLGGRRGARTISLMWLGFCLSCGIGYWIGGQIGLLAVTLPAIILFLVNLYVSSLFLLPLRDRSQHKEAFRSLLTFALGTNYPYMVIKDRKLEERVKGSPFKAFLSGPGIIITGCDHVVVLTNGARIKDPEEPGLTFTGRFEVVQSIIDLRPQLRTFLVDAHTLDGIAIRVLTFVAFRICWGGQKPTLGKPYPFQAQAVLQAITNEVVESHQDHKHNWDDLVEIQATRVMRDIISRYRFDDFLLAIGPFATGPEDILLRYEPDQQPSPSDPRREPRYRIRDEMVARLKKEMRVCGIEVIGGGISNLAPVDEQANEQRVVNWRTKWQTRIALAHAEGEARGARLVEFAKVAVEQDLWITVAKMLDESLRDGVKMSDELLAATLVASLERMAEKHSIKDQLPVDTKQRLAYLRSQGRSLLHSAASSKGQGAT